MAKRVSIRHKRRAAPDWVFPWRPLGMSPLPKWLAVLLVGGAFAFFLTSVRVRVSPPTPWAPRKASVIHVTDDAVGRALTLRAREGGPFPSRFEPSEWEGGAAMVQTAFESARSPSPSYVPALRDLPVGAAPAMCLAAKGEPVWPKHRSAARAPQVSAKLKLAPVLYPRSGISAASMPQVLPPFDSLVDEKITAETWHILVRLDAAGNVQDCVSLAGAAGADPSPLEDWLRRVSFNPEPSKPSRWIAVGLGFTNQPIDGTDAR